MEFIDHNPTIFILSGKAKSGKNAVAKMIKEYYCSKKCLELSYALPLKEYSKNITGWDGGEDTKPRDFLQSLGIDLIKKINPTFLIDRVCEDIGVYRYFYDVIIITDARLKEEIEIPRKKLTNVTVIRIVRNDFDNALSSKQKEHITETDLDNYQDFDYILYNENNLEQLKIDVNHLLKEVNYE